MLCVHYISIKIKWYQEVRTEADLVGSLAKRGKGLLIVFSILKGIPTSYPKCNNQNHHTMHKEALFLKSSYTPSSFTYVNYCPGFLRLALLLLFDYFYWNADCLLLNNYINYTGRAQLLNLFQKKPLVSIKEFYGGSPHVRFHTAGYTGFL